MPGVSATWRLLAQRHLALLICGAALLLKLLVPAGYMIGDYQGAITVTICSGMASETMTLPVTGMSGDMAEMHGAMPDHGKPREHGKGEMPCVYSGLSAQSLAAVDTVLLLAALAVVAALTLRAVPASTARIAPYLRPPLRGPPLLLN